jgi:hypothetical protein
MAKRFDVRLSPVNNGKTDRLNSGREDGRNRRDDPDRLCTSVHGRSGSLAVACPVRDHDQAAGRHDGSAGVAGPARRTGRTNPEAFDPNRLPTTPEAVAAALRARPGRPRSGDPTEVVAMRLPRSVIAALEGLVTARQEAEPNVTRQDVLREAVRLYLER